MGKELKNINTVTKNNFLNYFGWSHSHPISQRSVLGHIRLLVAVRRTRPLANT